MCGIAGFFKIGLNGFKCKYKCIDTLNKMNIAQKHRGPDGSGIFFSNCCGLSHVRLAIRDIENGSQPITRSIGNKKYTIVYSGEIYNINELKEEILSFQNIYFETKSDTEVILIGHLLFGESFVKKINGIFAYAIFDETEQKLFLYRDRVGVKPLFYTMSEDVIIFASEIKAIFEYEGVQKKVDIFGLCEIFGLGPAKTSGKAIFKDVFEVLPGHYILVGKRGMQQTKYWGLKSRYHLDSFKETVSKTKYLVCDAIKRQLAADVPVCTFLSGGIDSSIVTAIAALELKKNGEVLNTFSFDYVDNNKYFKSHNFQPSQDRPWVEKVVSFIKTNNTYLECNINNLLYNIFRAVDARDLPCMADVESSLLYFCSKVALKNKVALTGECADEIFGGYPWFYKEYMFKANTFPWSLNINSRKLLLKNSFLKSLPLDEYVKYSYESTVNKTPRLYGENKKERRRREVCFLNLKWFMQNLLDRMDRTSMYSGLEARVPFADHRIIEYIWNVPWNIKCPKGVVKGLLREAFKGCLPNDVLKRQKSPYPKTYNPAYEKALKEVMLQVINDCNSPILNFVSKKKMEEFLKTPQKYNIPWYGQLMAGPQMLAYMLQVNYWFLKYNVSIC